MHFVNLLFMYLRSMYVPPALIRSSEVWCLKCGDATRHFWINNEYHFANILIAFSIIEHFLRQGPHKPGCVDSSFLVYLTTYMHEPNP